MDREEVLLELAHRLEDKYGVKPGIFHEVGCVLLKDAAEQANPIHPEEIDSILREVANKFKLRTTELAYSVSNGDILVGFFPTHTSG